MMLLDRNVMQASELLFDDVPMRVQAATRAAPAEISIVIPTFNERANIGELIDRIRTVLADTRWEIIIVDDDSPDGTAEQAHALHWEDARVRVIRRVGRRGLCSACIEGILSSSATYVAVMDADLQHDPALLGEMLAILRRGQADIVYASRHCAGGSVGDWEEHRIAASRLARWAASQAVSVPLSDPMSGYFAMRRGVMEKTAHRVSGVGFKILLDIILASDRTLRLTEVPLTFASRTRGTSKLSSRVVWDYAAMLIEHRSGGAIMAQDVSNAALGMAGLSVNLLTLSILFGLGKLSIGAAATLSALASCVAVFATSSLLSRRTYGPWRWYLALLPFAGACTFGVVADGVVTTLLVGAGWNWFASGLSGALAGAALMRRAIRHHL
jgi:dolichol-phosphate mannosyltransferase